MTKIYATASLLFSMLSLCAQKSQNEYYFDYVKAIEGGQFEKAIQIGEQWKSDFPNDVDPYYRSAKALSKRGRKVAAIDALHEALSKDSTHIPSLLYLAELSKPTDNMVALDIYDRLASMSPVNSYFFREAAECAVEGQKFEMAMSYYTKAYALDSLDIITINGFAKLCIDFKQYQDANILLDRTLKIDSLNAFALLTKAKLAFAQANWAETLELLAPLLERNPPKTAFRYQGIALYHSGKYDESIEVMRALSNIAPDIDYPHYYMGLCMQKLGQNERATLQFQQAVNKSLSKNLAVYYERLGLSQQELKDHEKAIKNIQMAMNFSGKNILNYHLAKSYDIYYQDQSIALKVFQEFVEREGENKSAEKTYAQNRIDQMKKNRHFEGK